MLIVLYKTKWMGNNQYICFNCAQRKALMYHEEINVEALVGDSIDFCIHCDSCGRLVSPA